MAAIYAAAASPRPLGQDRDGFPPRGYVTFNEVVSSFNKCGNIASRRHSKLFLAQQTRMPSNVATIRDNTVNFRSEAEREPLKQVPSSRGSRTPSPWPTGRRPWSQPATPRGAWTPTQGPRGSRDYWPSSFQYNGDGLGDALDGDYSDRSARGGRETFLTTRPRSARPSGAKYPGAERSTTSSAATTVGSLAHARAVSSQSASSWTPRAPELLDRPDTSRSSVVGSRPEFAGVSPRLSEGGAEPSQLPPRARSAGRRPEPGLGDCQLPASPVARSRIVLREPCSVADSLLGSVSSSQGRPLLRPTPQVDAGFRDFGSTSKGVSSASASGGPSSREPSVQRGDASPLLPPREMRSCDTPHTGPLREPLAGGGTAALSPCRSATGSDPRAPSFLRLNGFLLRTHVTSLTSALAEDGWLEAWEKERLCRQVREDSQPWTAAFLRIYSRLMETDDVGAFVAGLRALAA